MKLNSIISAVLLASLSTQAFAARFYLVVPLTKAEEKVVDSINVVLTDAQLPAAALTEPYHFDLGSTLSVTGDPAYAAENVSWALVQNALPAGLSLSPTGIISGVPTARQSAEFDAQATYKSKADVGRYAIVVEGVPVHKIDVALAATSLPAGEVSTAYSYDLKPALSVTGDPEYTSAQAAWSATGLPAGMALSADGVLSGTPSASQITSIHVTATYRTKAGSRTYSLVINPVAVSKISVSLAAVSLPAGEVSTAYSYDLKQALSVTGDPEYTSTQVTWSATGLPAGMTLSPSGILSGTPSASQTASIPVTATYRTKTGTRTYSLVINGVDPSKISVALASASLPAGKVNTSYSYDFRSALSVSGDPEYTAGNVTWSASGLPAGLALADGVLSGTPTEAHGAGTNITVNATYRGKVGSQAYSLVIAPVLADSNLAIRTTRQVYGFEGNYPKYLATAMVTNNSGQALTVTGGMFPGAWAAGAEKAMYQFDIRTAAGTYNAGTLSTGQTLMLYWDRTNWSIHSLN